MKEDSQEDNQIKRSTNNTESEIIICPIVVLGQVLIVKAKQQSHDPGGISAVIGAYSFITDALPRVQERSLDFQKRL